MTQIFYKLVKPKLFLLLLFVAAIYSNTAYAQKTWQLEAKGNVRDEDSKEALAGAKIEILKNGQPYKTIFADESGNFRYSLDPDNVYTITVSYNSYVTKFITITTENTPNDDEVTGNFNATTEFRLFKRIEGVDYSPLDSPIGSIFYDPEEKRFNFNVVDFDLKKKLEEMKKEMERKKAEQAAKEKADKEAAIKRAAFVKDSTAKAEADAKKKAIADAEEAKKKAAAEAKAAEDAKKQALAAEEAAKKKAAADAEAAAAEEKRKAKAAEDAAKEEARKKAEQEELDKVNAKKKAEQDAADKIAAAKKAEQDAKDQAAAKKKEEALAAFKAAEDKKKAEEEEKAKQAALKKSQAVVPPPPAKEKAAAPTQFTPPPVVKKAPPEKPIESAPPEVIQPENVRYDEFDYGTYHVFWTYITTGGVEYQFQRIQHKWGGLFFKRDGLDITEGTYKKEFRKYGLKP